MCAYLGRGREEEVSGVDGLGRYARPVRLELGVVLLGQAVDALAARCHDGAPEVWQSWGETRQPCTHAVYHTEP